MHPQHGVVLSTTAVRRLAARAPDHDRAEEVIDWLDQVALPEINRRKKA